MNKSLAHFILLTTFCSFFSATSYSEDDKPANNIQNAVDSKGEKNNSLEKKTVTKSKQQIFSEVLPGNYTSVRFKKHQKERPIVYFGRQQAILLDDDTHWKVLIGVSKNTHAGKYLVTVVEKDKTNFEYAFNVLPQASITKDTSPKQKGLLKRFSIRKKNSERSKVKIPKRIPWSNIEPKLPLDLPLDRSLIQVEKGSGLDNNFNGLIFNLALNKPTNENFIASQELPTRSPSNAIVLSVKKTDNRYSVWLDHGMGLLSYVSGLSSISIEEQDVIKRASVIGYFGASSDGDISSNKLEWWTLINRQFIHPLKFNSKK